MESNICVEVQEGIDNSLANRGMVDEENVKLTLDVNRLLPYSLNVDEF